MATREALEQKTTAAQALSAALDSAKARMMEAKRRLKETVLYAPFSGTVTSVHLQPGEWAMPGQPVVAVSGDGAVELKAEVSECAVRRLQPQQKVVVRLPFDNGRVIEGKIESVAGAAYSAGKLFPIVVSLDAGEKVFAGMTAELIVDLNPETILTVPMQAIIAPGGSQPAVFKLTDNRVCQIDVTLGAVVEDRVAVTGALEAGTVVAISGLSLLQDGDAVAVK